MDKAIHKEYELLMSRYKINAIFGAFGLAENGVLFYSLLRIYKSFFCNIF